MRRLVRRTFSTFHFLPSWTHAKHSSLFCDRPGYTADLSLSDRHKYSTSLARASNASRQGDATVFRVSPFQSGFSDRECHSRAIIIISSMGAVPSCPPCRIALSQGVDARASLQDCPPARSRVFLPNRDRRPPLPPSSPDPTGDERKRRGRFPSRWHRAPSHPAHPTLPVRRRMKFPRATRCLASPSGESSPLLSGQILWRAPCRLAPTRGAVKSWQGAL